MTTKDAVTFLINEMKRDPSYRFGWQSNIAMSFYDCAYRHKKKGNKHYLSNGDVHVIANEAANEFLNLLAMDVNE